MSGTVRKAVFPVGGMGTRFLPATKAMPKEMLPVVDKPLIQYAVEEARDAGIEEFIFVTGRGKASIENHFDRSVELEALLAEKDKDKLLGQIMDGLPDPGQVAYTRQGSPMGLGHAIWCARNLVGNEPFAILLADDFIHSDVPCLKQMIDAQADIGGNMLALMDVPQEHTSRYGVVDPGETNGRCVTVKGLVEKPSPDAAPSNHAVIGRYILQPDVFDYLEGQGAGAGGEIQLTDAMAKMIGSAPFNGYRFEGTRYDCGDKVGFLEATLAIALERPDLREGVVDFIRRQAL